MTDLTTRQQLIDGDRAAVARHRAKVQALTELEQRALDLLATGAGWPHIAKVIGKPSALAAQKFTMRALDKRAAQITATGVDAARALLLHRIDLLLSTFLPQALMGDEKAGRLVLDALTRQERLLGLSAPKRHEHHHEVDVTDKTQRVKAIIDTLQRFHAQRVIEGETA